MRVLSFLYIYSKRLSIYERVGAGNKSPSITKVHPVYQIDQIRLRRSAGILTSILVSSHGGNVNQIIIWIISLTNLMRRTFSEEFFVANQTSVLMMSATSVSIDQSNWGNNATTSLKSWKDLPDTIKPVSQAGMIVWRHRSQILL